MEISSFNRLSPCATYRVIIYQGSIACLKSPTVYKKIVLSLASMLLMMFFSFSIPNAQAADWYVRSGATGLNNGRDWINAWHDFDHVTGVSAGDTVWIAGGTYVANLSPATSGTPLSRIYYRRVMTADSVPASADSWSSSYDSKVIFSGANIRWSGNIGDYVTIDGRIDGGIQVTASDSDFGAGVIFTTANNGVTIQYVDMGGQAGDTIHTFNYDASSLYINNSTNLTIAHCRIHGSVNLIKMLSATNATFEYNKIYNNLVANSATWHPNMIISTGGQTVTFRYNETYNWMTEGIMMYGAPQAWYVYGNIWHDSFGSSYGRVLEAQEQTHTVYFYNNTVKGVWAGIRTANGGSWSPSSVARNNIFWNVASISSLGSNDDYNFTDTSVAGSHSINGGSNPFVGTGNLHIVSTIGAVYPRNKGVALSSGYAIDMDGNARGGDGTWDIGAFEFNSSGSSAPSSPSLLRIN